MDLLFTLALFTVLLGGVVRGFSGFGAAMVMTPLLAVILTPAEAVYYSVVLSLLGSVFMSARSARQANWKAVMLLFVASVPLILAGNAALIHIPPITMRIIFAILIIVIATAILSGWIYRGEPRKRYTLIAGGISGFMYGSIGSGGPPAAMYLSGTDDDKTRVRATVLMHAILCLIFSLAGLSTFGTFFVAPDWHLGAMAAAHFAGVYGGEKLFHAMGGGHYDRIVLWFMVLLGTTSLYLALHSTIMQLAEGII